MMVQLTEGAIYEVNGQTLLAVFMLGTWTLQRLGDVPMGDVAAYRQMQEGWRECRFAPTVTGSELFYGSLIQLDLAVATGIAANSADLQTDEVFASLMAPLSWEWK